MYNQYSKRYKANMHGYQREQKLLELNSFIISNLNLIELQTAPGVHVLPESGHQFTCEAVEGP
jgi:hypothetical protein